MLLLQLLNVQFKSAPRQSEAATVDAVIERRVVATALCRRAFWVAV